MKQIISRNIVLTPKDNKTNIIIKFMLKQDYESLHFKTDYSPKFLQDDKKAKILIDKALDDFMGDTPQRSTVDWKKYLPLTNLITFSLDAEQKHLGCVHRGAPKQDFMVSENEASLGLETHSPTKGEYRVVLNVHSVITDSCEYKLEVYAGEEGENG